MAGEALLQTLEEIPAVDHHAHLLAGPGSEPPLESVLTEAAEPSQIERVRDHPAYTRALRELASVLEVEPTAEALAEARGRMGFEGYGSTLLRACRFAEVLVDDGFRFPGALPLEEVGRLAGCPTRRVLRIESAAEEAADGWPLFAEFRERFRVIVEGALGAGAAGLKTAAAYRAGLDLPPADEAEAETAYSRWSRNRETRWHGDALVAYSLAEALDVIRERPVPLQVHCGMGDADMDLRRSDPAHLRWLFEDRRYRSVPVVLLHCYPFVGNASYLAGVYPNAFLDLSLAITFAAHRGDELVLEALDLAPASKLLFATDANRLPELYLLGARWGRASLARALGRLIDDDLVDEATALRWAEMILAGNARSLYG